MVVPFVNSQFGKQSTADDVLANVDLKDHLAVLTGATSGIGIATAKALVSAGADLVIGARNQKRLTQLLNELKSLNGKGALHGYSLDLMNLESVDGFADAVLNLKQPINILINNAGVIGPLKRNDDGIESQLMTNFIGHAVLTSRLASRLQQADSARVVSLSSYGHHYADINVDDLNFEQRPYEPWAAYGQSKTACALLAVQVTQKMTGVEAFAVHPGAIMTALGSELKPEDIALAKEKGSIPAPNDWKTPEQGAATSLWTATAKELAGHAPLYLEDCKVAEILESPTYNYGVMPYALDPTNAEKLWRATEQFINRKLPL